VVAEMRLCRACFGKRNYRLAGAGSASCPLPLAGWSVRAFGRRFAKMKKALGGRADRALALGGPAAEARTLAGAKGFCGRVCFGKGFSF
jgi:hypothetical protein